MQGGKRIARRINGTPQAEDLQQPLTDGAVVAVYAFPYFELSSNTA